jgi:hypothetical protein
MLGEGRPRPHPDTDDDKVSFEPFPALQCHPVSIECSGRCAKVENDTVLLVYPAYQVADFGPENGLHWTCFGRHDTHLEPTCAQ